MEYWWYLFFFVQGACVAGLFFNSRYTKHQKTLLDFITYQHQVIEDANRFIQNLRKKEIDSFETVIYHPSQKDHSIN